MAYLLYSALSVEGTPIRGLGNYSTLEDLDKELSRHGEQLVDFHMLSDGVGRFLEFFRSKPKPLEIAEFCATLSNYVAGGVELQGALADAAESARKSAMRSAIVEIRRRLKSGYSLSESMRMTGRFPEVVINMTRIGEEGGNLARMLKDAADHIERVQAIKSAVRRALIYPAFTLTVVVAAGIFWMTMVVPKIVELFEAMQVELDSSTLMLIAMSEFFGANWPYLLVAVVALPFCWILALRNKQFRLKTDQGIWNTPLVGRVVHGSQMAFYFQYLSLMYGAGVVINTALSTMQGALSNRYFASRVSRMLADIQTGIPLAKAFRDCEVFPLLDQRMVAIGEQTGNLEEQLQKLADIHFTRVQNLVEVLPKFIEPIMLVILGSGFAFFIIALIGPLYGMLSTVGGA